MSRYRDYIVEIEIFGKKFRTTVHAFNEDNVRLQVKNKIVFSRIEEKQEEPKPNQVPEGFEDLFNTIFGNGKK